VSRREDSEIVQKEREERNGIIADFDRRNRQLEQDCEMKRKEIWQIFEAGVQALKRKASAKCQVLEADMEVIARFVGDIVKAIDESVNKCVKEKEEALEEDRREAMRTRAVEVTRSMWEEPPKEAVPVIRKRARTAMSSKRGSLSIFDTQPHSTFSDGRAKS
jgi:hypothetical protein